MPIKTDSPITYIQFFIYLVMLVLGVGICWAKMDQRLINAETQLNTVQNDHIEIAILKEKLDRIQKDISETASNIKEIKNKLNTL